jgi:hypothetical protein
MIMWMRVYYEQKIVILQSGMFINRVSRIIHYLALFFHKRLNQEEYWVFGGRNLWRISSMEL